MNAPLTTLQQPSQPRPSAHRVPPAPAAAGKPLRASGRAPIARLTWLLARPSTQSSATIVLPAVAFAVTTALLLIVLGGALMFWGWTNEMAGTYQILSILALALLTVPLATLSGAAARLSARRRDDRLATLRLIGATPGVVTGITVLESTVVAFIGSLAGVVLYAASMPLVGLIPFGGEPIGAASLWLGVPIIAAVVAGVALLAAISAVVGLRAVIVSPLGVRTRQSPQRVHWLRGVISVVAVIVAFTVLNALGVLPDMAAVVFALGATFAIGVAILNLIGPWAISLVAKVQVRSARKPAKLIAGRGILESPKAAWRQVSGMAMTSFVAVVAGTGVAFVDSFENAGEFGGEDALFFNDVRTGILITLIASFVMVACSVGVNQAAAILDRRDLYVGLDRVGMPREVMEHARSRTTMVPLTFVVVGSALVGAVLVLPLAGITLILAPLSMLVIVGCFGAGLLLVWSALLATRPVLTSVLAEPAKAAD